MWAELAPWKLLQDTWPIVWNLKYLVNSYTTLKGKRNMRVVFYDKLENVLNIVLNYGIDLNKNSFTV